MKMEIIFERLMKAIAKSSHGDIIVLLKEINVLRWIFNDLSFLKSTIPEMSKTASHKMLKIEEDNWGKQMLFLRRPDLVPSGQWTTKLGEHLCEEIQYLLGKTPKKPKNIQGLEPDIETEDYIIEVKTQTFYTEGTAGEKIMGVPIKYSDVPYLYEKPLKILCIGCAEKLAREKYGVLSGKGLTASKQKIIDFWKSMQIEYVGATDWIEEVLGA